MTQEPRESAREVLVNEWQRYDTLYAKSLKLPPNVRLVPMPADPTVNTNLEKNA